MTFPSAPCTRERVLQRHHFSRSRFKASGSKGFPMCSFMPDLRHSVRSVFMALAGMAIIGRELKRSSPRDQPGCLIAVRDGHLDAHKDQCIVVCLNILYRFSPLSAQPTSRSREFRMGTAIFWLISLSSTYSVRPDESGGGGFCGCRPKVPAAIRYAGFSSPRGAAVESRTIRWCLNSTRVILRSDDSPDIFEWRISKALRPLSSM